ncbi:MAG TPA: 2-dehydropantoate 2-reductase [Candidatus Limnocylindria bacterium]|nr:2-dehydropantoate 2-reductase [Candidatus Limnocylindria bacterium]
MRVAVLGLGAIGTLVSRTLDGRLPVTRVDRTKAPLNGQIEPVDLAIVTTKSQGTAWAAETAKRVLATRGTVITIQNGLGHRERLAAVLGDERVAVGVIYVGAALTDGELRTTGPGRVELGRAPYIDELAAALRAGGMAATVVDDPWPAVWRKLVGNAAVNPVSALVGVTNGELLQHLASRIVDAAARETARVATAEGVPISDDEAQALWRSMAELTAANRSSMLQDVRSGRPTEIDWINGEVARRGRRHSLPTPVNDALLKLVEVLEAYP